jgi:hypothetical protein
MAIGFAFPPRKSVVSPKRWPPKPEASPLSPLRALCVRNAYWKHQPETYHRPWKGQSKLALGPEVETTESDKNGFIAGKKLQPYEFRIMHLQHKSTFPPCLGINRMYFEEKLFPQYGDIKSAMFKQTRRLQPHILLTKRAELLATFEDCEGVQVPQPPKRKEIVEAVTEYQEKKLKQKIKAHLKRIEEQKRIDREIRKAKKKTTFAWLQGIVG